jgi:hypothetical protein
MDEIGGEEKSLCIMVRFDNTLDEMFVMARAVNAVLAGRRPQTPVEPTVRDYLESHSLLAEANQKATAEFNSSAVQQVSHVAAKDGEREKSKVLTIPLSADMTRRVMESGNEPVAEHPVVSPVIF